ncbi:hypothetical protein [Polaromonas sp. JS666]|uniref:hypothetical protein n=1 Tax=Polaromonas sp. (strain JS666 / ATCC BAA-500) TaxID=296591 RepID=UPI000053804D|nr:hypothetical protein [Polaromonas sp. JS666]ABE46880.1 hypothetical protein Bpro_5008 [Polaromonas sp. JS666]
MAKRRRKSSRMANLIIRINSIANGMAQSGPKSPVFIVKNKKIIKLKRNEYDRLVEEADSLSYFAGYQIRPEQLIK